MNKEAPAEEMRRSVDIVIEDLLASIAFTMLPEDLYPKEGGEEESLHVSIKVGRPFAQMLQKFVIAYADRGRLEGLLDSLVGYIFIEGLRELVRKWSKEDMKDFVMRIRKEDPDAYKNLMIASLSLASRKGRLHEVLKKFKEEVGRHESETNNEVNESGKEPGR